MSLPHSGWGWWGDEAGKRLDVARNPDGSVAFTVSASPTRIETVTLSSFRIRQLIDWLSSEDVPAMLPVTEAPQ